MPEIRMYTNDLDDREIAQFLLSERARLVPELKYMSPKYQEISSEAAFVEERKKTRHFFVVRNDFSRQPLEVVLNEMGPAPFHMIMPRNGGPALSLLCGGSTSSDEGSLILPAELHYYPTYWDTSAKKNRPAPREEVAFFKLFEKYVKRSFTQMRSGSRRFWVGPGAFRERGIGAKLVGVDS